MKKVIMTLSLVFASCLTLLSQIQEPVKWSFSEKELSANTIELTFKAIVENDWWIYGTAIPEGGPVATKVVFEDLSGAELIGAVTTNPKAKEKYDNMFLMTIGYFEKTVSLKQKLKITGESYAISGYVEYMACNNVTCLQPTREPFEFKGKKKTTTVVASSDPSTTITTPSVVIPPVTVDSTSTAHVAEIPEDQNAISDESQIAIFWEPVIDQMQQDMPDRENGFLWWIFIKGFLGGLIAIFTPCVWPIIPMTVSFFLKRSDNRRKGKRDAALYGASIIVIYLLLGILITLIFGANALNSLSTSAFFNLLFFALLVVFGASFLGAFEITLPSSWTTKLDRKAESSSGMWSIFLMAFTLALVSFSCTGPIIGTLLVDVSVSGSILGPAIGMFGFALALSIPFTFFAMFPAWMRVIPKSGGWLNSVKVTLGFLELAFALKFLSVADLAYGWGILDREVFLVLWIVLFAMLGAYLIGKLRFVHDSDLTSISFHRLMLSLAAFAFAIYMVPGLWGAPLKAISAFAPPLSTQDFNLYTKEVEAKFYDYDEAMLYAAKENKPVVVYFTGHACVNCRKMKESMWIEPQVKQMLTEKYVLVSLYVDDRAKLEKPYTITENGKEYNIKTVADKWSYLQRYKFGANAQPYYVLLDNQGKPLNKYQDYTEDLKEFTQFLEVGLSRYESIKK